MHVSPVTGGKTPLHRLPSADGQNFTSVWLTAANSLPSSPAPAPNDVLSSDAVAVTQRWKKICWKDPASVPVSSRTGRRKALNHAHPP
ncbi:hypothetical protein KCP74_22450 [Salmonella enterica subsp. enterica]|nr:hypothetical protein KCP74_22450 [Salmonella enterica subsp. enterica]